MFKRLLILLVLLLVAAGLYIGLGVYNIAADQPHWAVTENVLEILRERAIEVRSEDIEVPTLDDPAMIAAGARGYDEMCAACHLAPGQAPTELHEGLYPEPPELIEHGIHDPREAFWVIKHGIKLTGMPAWGKSHSDADIWAMVAFLARAKGMSPEQYRQLVASAPAGHGHTHGASAADAMPAHDDHGHDHSH